MDSAEVHIESSDRRPCTRRRDLLYGTILSVGSVAVCLLLSEFVVFRFVWPAGDTPANWMDDGVIKYVPGQTGVIRIANEIRARYRINSEGWNSRHADYARSKPAGLTRVAIIGDSYVEALSVDYRSSLAEQAEDTLGHGYEVYRFGVSGAPLSQYLFMLEREVTGYRPDIVFVVLVHNDFDESYKYMPGRYTSSFMKLDLSGWPRVRELPPQPYQQGWVDLLRHSALFRFFVYRERVNPDALKRVVFRERPAFEANIDTRNVAAEETSMYRAAAYCFRRMKEICEANHIRLVFLMDAVRAAIYSGRPPGPAGLLNALAARAATDTGVEFQDLTRYFYDDWARRHERFEFQHDGHWNLLGHAIAARAITDRIRTRSASRRVT